METTQLNNPSQEEQETKQSNEEQKTEKKNFLIRLKDWTIGLFTKLEIKMFGGKEEGYKPKLVKAFTLPTIIAFGCILIVVILSAVGVGDDMPTWMVYVICGVSVLTGVIVSLVKMKDIQGAGKKIGFCFYGLFLGIIGTAIGYLIGALGVVIVCIIAGIFVLYGIFWFISKMNGGGDNSSADKIKLSNGTTIRKKNMGLGSYKWVDGSGNEYEYDGDYWRMK